MKKISVTLLLLTAFAVFVTPVFAAPMEFVIEKTGSRHGSTEAKDGPSTSPGSYYWRKFVAGDDGVKEIVAIPDDPAGCGFFSAFPCESKYAEMYVEDNSGPTFVWGKINIESRASKYQTDMTSLIFGTLRDAFEKNVKFNVRNPLLITIKEQVYNIFLQPSSKTYTYYLTVINKDCPSNYARLSHHVRVDGVGNERGGVSMFADNFVFDPVITTSTKDKVDIDTELIIYVPPGPGVTLGGFFIKADWLDHGKDNKVKVDAYADLIVSCVDSCGCKNKNK